MTFKIPSFECGFFSNCLITSYANHIIIAYLFAALRFLSAYYIILTPVFSHLMNVTSNYKRNWCTHDSVPFLEEFQKRLFSHKFFAESVMLINVPLYSRFIKSGKSLTLSTTKPYSWLNNLTIYISNFSEKAQFYYKRIGYHDDLFSKCDKSLSHLHILPTFTEKPIMRGINPFHHIPVDPC